jgi:hypothetical protein
METRPGPVVPAAGGDVAMAGAPVVPNASRVEGTLLAIEPEPDGVGSVWKIAVERSDDVEGLPGVP